MTNATTMMMNCSIYNSFSINRACSSELATTSSSQSNTRTTSSNNKMLIRKIYHNRNHNASILSRTSAKKKTYESAKEAAEDLLFYNEEDLIEDDGDDINIRGISLLQLGIDDEEKKTKKKLLSQEGDQGLIIEDFDLININDDDDFDDDFDDIEGDDDDDDSIIDIASFLKKKGKIDSENDFDFKDDLNFDVITDDDDNDYFDDEDGDDDDDEDDFIFIPNGSGIEFKSEDLFNIDTAANDFGFLPEYVKRKPGFDKNDSDNDYGDHENKMGVINTASRSPRKSRSKNDIFVRDTSKDRAPKKSEFDSKSEGNDYLAFGADDATKMKKRLENDAKNAKLIQMGVPKALLEQIEREQELVNEANEKKKKKNLDSFGEEKKTHKRLQIVAGKHSRRVILTPSGMNTRPMMGVVRGATFDMILSLVGSRSNVQFPENSRWLDLFAGTGAIGLEALSRGCVDAHFVEMDEWTVKNVTRVNIKTLKEDNNAVAHCASVETFLQRHSKSASGAGGSFNFISFCPPYEKVSYPELLLTLDNSPLVSDDAVVLVEYASGQRDEIKASIGKRLRRVRNRRYGRTFVALYVCDGRDVDEDDVEEPKLHGKNM
jgi:16S rRNA (guanine(966)-N(2))-methyltransferase RsmD